MLEATRKEAEAKREAQRQAARAAELERKLQEIERAKEKPEEKPEPKGRPKVEDFEDFDSYLDARDKHNREEWQREETEKAQERAAREHATKVVQYIEHATNTYKSAIAEAGGPDFLARQSQSVLGLSPSYLLDEGEKPGADNILADEIIRAGKKAPALLQHLTEHDDDLQRILALRSKDDVRVEARLIVKGLSAATAGTSAKPRVSQAPPPVRPVTGVPHTASDEPDAEKDDYDTYVRKANGRERRAR
jgi:hypothetical protein